MTTVPAPRLARVGVSVLFFVNGALYSNWVPRIPAVKEALSLSDGALGLALLGAGLGALGGSVAGGALVARLGSRRVSLIGGLALAAALSLPGLAPSWAWLAVSLVLLGAADAVIDVGMNAHGVSVQTRYGRSIINAFHAFWSLGAVAGSLTGSLAAALAVPVALHLGVVGVLLGLLMLAAAPLLLHADADRERVRTGPVVTWPSRAVGALGLLTLLAALVEDTPASWSAVYLAEDLGTSPGVAGLGFAAFTVAMTAARLAGDRVVDRLGPARAAGGGTLLAAGGLTAGLLIGTPIAAMAGFALVGLGVATVFPLAFSAAGNLPGLPAGAAIGMVSLLARVGFLIAPPLVGLLAELISLRVALGVIVVAALAIAALSRRLR